MSEENAESKCPRCGEKMLHLRGFGSHGFGGEKRVCLSCWMMSKENPAPDWDKINKLLQRMNELVDEIEKEINDETRNEEKAAE